jgi:hypothetical protein
LITGDIVNVCWRAETVIVSWVVDLQMLIDTVKSAGVNSGVLGGKSAKRSVIGRQAFVIGIALCCR